MSALKRFVPKMTKMDIQKFREMLERHDWYYEMSDDPRVYWNGSQTQADIFSAMKEIGDPAKTLYEEYCDKYYAQFRDGS